MYRYKKQAAKSDGPKYCSRLFIAVVVDTRRRAIAGPPESQGTSDAAIINTKMPQINTPNIICDPRLKRETSYKHYCTCERRPAVNVAAYVYTINIINIFMVKNDPKTFVRHNELHNFNLNLFLNVIY